MTRRQRPKVYRKTADSSRLLRRWRSWLPSMGDDLSHLIGKREIFWGLQEVAKENNRFLDPRSFFDWMCENYVVTASIEIRKFVDADSRSRSLWRMLYEILEYPGIINREQHVAIYTPRPGQEYGQIAFDNVVGRKCLVLPQQQIRSDLRKIEDASERIRKFVNKRVAHRARPGALRRLPKFNELDGAIDAVDVVFCKYNLLLSGHAFESMHAHRQYNWRKVLWDPWIPTGSTLHPET